MDDNYDDDNTITIDVDALRRDMRNESLGAAFGGGFGGAFVEASDIDRLSPEELVERALRQGIDILQYQV